MINRKSGRVKSNFAKNVDPNGMETSVSTL